MRHLRAPFSSQPRLKIKGVEAIQGTDQSPLRDGTWHAVALPLFVFPLILKPVSKQAAAF